MKNASNSQPFRDLNEHRRIFDINDVRRRRLGDVQRKANAAKLWCMIATDHHAKPNGEKPWRYLLVPDDAVQANATLTGLIGSFTQAPDMELMGQFELATA